MESTREIQTAVKARRSGRLRIGRRYSIVLGIAVGLIALVVVWVWRMRSLDGLPDVGDPFDLTEALKSIEISDDNNAYVSYSEANRLLAVSKMPDAVTRVDWEKATWSTSGPEVRAFLEENSPALEAWRVGTKRPDARYYQPGMLAADSELPVVQNLRVFGWLAALEGTRLQDKGAMDEAWSWYNCILRSSRHAGKHGVVIERMVGAAIFDTACRRISHWAADPRVDAVVLRRALAELLEADAMTPPLSESMKLEYLMFFRDLKELRVIASEIPMPGGQSGWIEKVATSTGTKAQLQRARLRITNDIERSRRVLRLLFANWLPQLDKVASERAPIAIRNPIVIYANDASAQPSARVLAPTELDAAVGQTLFAHQFLRPGDQWPQGSAPWSGSAWEGDGALAREPLRRAVLIVTLAAELYKRERGKAPSNAGELLDGYLKELPPGIKSDDPIPAGID
jgi:hypothetical protein